jgi:precorrin-3B C17-methyltransferase
MVYIIGIGPGNADQMTLSARIALDRSNVILGYKTYIKLIKPLLAGNQEILASGMGDEVERARRAVELAKQGKTVAVVSSGDAGIYGMAGIVAEVIAEHGENTFDLEVVPGVPAFVAASALLGAPLMTDFVSISLSDHLAAWKDIQTRLKLAAQGDFSIALYNPRSKQRPTQLIRAREIICKYRPLTTPVGIVTNAFRDGQESAITDLQHMLDYETGMNTVIIIGNSQTFVNGGRMITRRGYQTKYVL